MSGQGLTTEELDLRFRPRRAEHVALRPVGAGAVAWAAAERPPRVVDAAGLTLLQLFDGRSSLQEIVDDLAAELADLDPEIDLGLGVLMTTQRFGLEGLLEGVQPVPPPPPARGLYHHLTDWIDPGVAAADVSSRADDTIGLGRAERVGLDFPGSPVRVTSTRPELPDLLRKVAPERVGVDDGVLLLSLVDGGEQRVGRSFFTLYGPYLERLVISADLDEVLQRALNHLALPLWVHEEPTTWWLSCRTLVHPDGTAVLFSSERLGQQVGLQRALEREGLQVVDRVLTALDPATGEVLLHPPRFGMQGVELAREAVGAPRRLRVGHVLLSQTDQGATDDSSEVVTKVLATATGNAAGLDRDDLLDGLAEVATSARRILLGQATPREVVDVLLERG